MAENTSYCLKLTEKTVSCVHCSNKLIHNQNLPCGKGKIYNNIRVEHNSQTVKVISCMQLEKHVNVSRSKNDKENILAFAVAMF